MHPREHRRCSGRHHRARITFVLPRTPPRTPSRRDQPPRFDTRGHVAPVAGRRHAAASGPRPRRPPRASSPASQIPNPRPAALPRPVPPWSPPAVVELKLRGRQVTPDQPEPNLRDRHHHAHVDVGQKRVAAPNQLRSSPTPRRTHLSDCSKLTATVDVVNACTVVRTSSRPGTPSTAEPGTVLPKTPCR